MSRKTALSVAGVLCALVLGCFLFLMGCSGGAPAPPPPPALNVYFAWGAVNNPFPACPSTTGPCNAYLDITDLTTGLNVTTLAVGTSAYSIPAPSGAQHQYALYTHIQNPDGTFSDSEQTLAVLLTE